MENTFKNNQEPKKQQQSEVLISDKELAMYNYIGLKLAYQQRQGDTMLQQIKDAQMQSLIKMNNRVTRPFCFAVILAIVGLIIKNSF